MDPVTNELEAEEETECQTGIYENIAAGAVHRTGVKPALEAIASGEDRHDHQGRIARMHVPEGVEPPADQAARLQRLVDQPDNAQQEQHEDRNLQRSSAEFRKQLGAGGRFVLRYRLEHSAS